MAGSGDEGGQRESLSRREWLKRVGGAAGGAAVLGGLPGCESSPPGTGEPAAGPPAPGRGLQPLRRDGTHPFDYIDTLVVLQMENRSFDHYFGSLSLNEGRSDVAGLRPELTNPGPDGEPIGLTHLTDSWEFRPDPPHHHGHCVQQWGRGANDGFVQAFAPRVHGGREALQRVMGYHDRSQLPTHYTLADHFALCDRWHSSLLGPTWPNRYYSHGATAEGRWGNAEGELSGPTPYRYLLDSGGSVGVYHAAGLWFAIAIGDLSLEEQNPKPVERFFDDARNGELPNVCLVEPDYFTNDDHPPSDIRLGQAFIASVYEALRRSPQWERSMLVVFYDEHGGFYDHVPPPRARGEPRADQGFAQLGFRVPGLVAGPLARRGEVVHTVYEHSSMPATISEIFGLPHVNERSRLANDLSSALDLSLTRHEQRPEAPPVPRMDVREGDIDRAMRRPCGQPELLDYQWRRRVAGAAELSERRRSKQRYLERAEALGAIRRL